MDVFGADPLPHLPAWDKFSGGPLTEPEDSRGVSRAFHNSDD